MRKKDLIWESVSKQWHILAAYLSITLSSSIFVFWKMITQNDWSPDLLALNLIISLIIFLLLREWFLQPESRSMKIFSIDLSLNSALSKAYRRIHSFDNEEEVLQRTKKLALYSYSIFISGLLLNFHPQETNFIISLFIATFSGLIANFLIDEELNADPKDKHGLLFLIMTIIFVILVMILWYSNTIKYQIVKEKPLFIDTLILLSSFIASGFVCTIFTRISETGSLMINVFKSK